MGTQVGWFLPLALALAAVAVVAARRGGGHRDLAAVVLWGTWLAVMGAAFSFGQGNINPYDTAALVPAVAGLLAAGSRALWTARAWALWPVLVAGLVASDALWSVGLLTKQGPGSGWLWKSVLATGMVSGLLWSRWPALARGARAVAAAGLGVVVLAGPLALTAGAVANPLPGSDPYATWPGGYPAAPGPVGGGQVAISRPGPALTNDLRHGGKGYRWALAVVGGDPAAGYQLASGEAVMAVGGWAGTDPVPTLARFRSLVARAEVRYFIPAGNYGGISLGASYDADAAVAITHWVTAGFAHRDVDGVALYDLARPLRAG
jgi:hypothetical protein